jgi:hypothetical protein
MEERSLALGADRPRYMQGLYAVPFVSFGTTRLTRFLHGILRFKQTLFGRSMKIFFVDLFDEVLSPAYRMSNRALLKRFRALKDRGNSVAFSRYHKAGAAVVRRFHATHQRCGEDSRKTRESLCEMISLFPASISGHVLRIMIIIRICINLFVQAVIVRLLQRVLYRVARFADVLLTHA